MLQEEGKQTPATLLKQLQLLLSSVTLHPLNQVFFTSATQYDYLAGFKNTGTYMNF